MRRRQPLAKLAVVVCFSAMLLVAGLFLWPSGPAERTATGNDPSTPSGEATSELPVGWQWVEVGSGRFGVPADWQVVSTIEKNVAHCNLYYSSPPKVLTGPEPPPVPCPPPYATNPGPGLRATTIADSPHMAPPDDAHTVDVNGWSAMRWTETRTIQTDSQQLKHRFAIYRIDALNLYLKARTDTAPELIHQVMTTLSSTHEPSFDDRHTPVAPA